MDFTKELKFRNFKTKVGNLIAIKLYSATRYTIWGSKLWLTKKGKLKKNISRSKGEMMPQTFKIQNLS